MQRCAFALYYNAVIDLSYLARIFIHINFHYVPQEVSLTPCTSSSSSSWQRDQH